MEWLEKYFVKGILKRVLDFLPFDSYKTYIGLVLLLAVVAVDQIFPAWDLSTVVTALLDWLGTLNAGDLTGFGGVVAVLGAIHKVLKRLYSEDE